MAGKIGSKKAPMPKNCKVRSEMSAPTTPIQLRATWVPVSAEALFSEGSSGEYEASARKRRSAETHNRSPISSFSRRLPVGTNMLARKRMWAVSHGRETVRGANRPEPSYYAKNEVAAAMAEFIRECTVGFRLNCRLLKMPHIRQDDHNDPKHNAVDDEHPQTIRLQVANEPGDRDVADNRGYDNPHQERRNHPGGQPVLAKFVRL